jgi:FlaA1/EpsC-like NDP-sugar epimerase
MTAVRLSRPSPSLLNLLAPSRTLTGALRRRIARGAIDVGVMTFALALAFVVRFESIDPAPWGAMFAAACIPVLVVRLAIARLSMLQTASWRLFALRDTEQLALAIGLGSLAMLLARLAWPSWNIPVGVIGLEGLFTLLGCWSVRVAVRALDEMHARGPKKIVERAERALLIGADRDGRLAAEALRANPDAGYEVVGFLDDAANRQGQRIAGVPVLGAIDDVEDVAARVGADVLILAMPQASRRARRDVVERCRASGLPIRTVPAYWELVGGKVEVSRIRKVKIEDLLGREVVVPDRARDAALLSAYRGKRILVTGAGGSIGSELCRQLAEIGPEKLILLEYSENNLFDIDNEIRAKIGDRTVAALVDIRDEKGLGRLFAKHKPEIVFHAAAYKHVPMMESHPAGAVDNNVRGTRLVVEAAQAHSAARLVLVSTDKAVNPTNVMGATKRAGEMIVQSRSRQGTTKMCCVRFGNVLGSRGSVLHTFQRQIDAGGPVTLTHPDITRFFMTIPEAVRLVLQAGTAGNGGEVFVLDMGEPVRIADMAAQMIELSGRGDDGIAIECCGLRPGEKLYEELAHDGEDLMPSGIPGINVVRPASLDAPTILPWVGRLEAAAAKRDGATIRQLLALGTGYKRGDAPMVEDDDALPDAITGSADAAPASDARAAS